MTNVTENWVQHPRFENILVSSLGNVILKAITAKVLHRTKVYNQRKLSLINHHTGYVVVSFRVNGKQRQYSVHRLVCETFYTKPSGKYIVNHINGIKSDNRSENLEWVTYSENQKHAYAIGLSKPSINPIPRNKHPRTKKVIDKITGETYLGAITVSEKFGLNYSTLRTKLQRNTSERFAYSNG